MSKFDQVREIGEQYAKQNDERLNLKDQWHIVGNYTNCFDCQRKIISADLQAPNGPVIMTDPKYHVCLDCQKIRNEKMFKRITQ